MFEVTHSRSHSLVSSWSVIQKFHPNCGLTHYSLVRTHETILYRVNPNVQFTSVTQSCLTLCNPMNHSIPGLPVHHQLLEFTHTHVHWVGDAIQPSHPLSSCSPPALNLSQNQGLFKWVSSLHQMAKVLESQLQHSPSNEHPALISFRMDWLDLLAVQGTLKSLLQHHSSKASILLRSAFFIVQLSHPWLLENP